MRIAILAIASSLLAAACASHDDGPRASVPSSFVGAEISQMQAAYGAPSRMAARADGSTVASFTVADARSAPRGAAVSTPRMIQPLTRTGQRPQRLSSGDATSASRATQIGQCVIEAAVNTDGVVTAVAASAEVCNHITPPR